MQPWQARTRNRNLESLLVLCRMPLFDDRDTRATAVLLASTRIPWRAARGAREEIAT